MTQHKGAGFDANTGSDRQICRHHSAAAELTNRVANGHELQTTADCVFAGQACVKIANYILFAI